MVAIKGVVIVEQLESSTDNSDIGSKSELENVSLLKADWQADSFQVSVYLFVF